jgi:regulator of replication initiation timing
MSNNERLTMELEIAEGLDEVEQLKQKLKYQQDECSALRIKFAKKRKKLAEYRAREREWMEKVESLLRENEALREEAGTTHRHRSSAEHTQRSGGEQATQTVEKNEANSRHYQTTNETKQPPARVSDSDLLPYDEASKVQQSVGAVSSTESSSVAPSADAPVQKVFGLQMVAPIIPYDLFKSLTEEIYIAKIVRAAQTQIAQSACVNAALTHHTHSPHRTHTVSRALRACRYRGGAGPGSG